MVTSCRSNCSCLLLSIFLFNLRWAETMKTWDTSFFAEIESRILSNCTNISKNLSQNIDIDSTLEAMQKLSDFETIDVKVEIFWLKWRNKDRKGMCQLLDWYRQVEQCHLSRTKCFWRTMRWIWKSQATRGSPAKRAFVLIYLDMFFKRCTVRNKTTTQNWSKLPEKLWFFS